VVVNRVEIIKKYYIDEMVAQKMKQHISLIMAQITEETPNSNLNKDQSFGK